MRQPSRNEPPRRPRAVRVDSTSMDFEQVDIHIDGPVARIVLDRPERLNALSARMIDELTAGFETMSSRSSIRVLVLEGAGTAFSVGHDLTDMVGEEEAYFQKLFAASTRLMRTMRETPQPIIAKVHGVAAAAGCQLVAACDLAVASEDARFGTTGLKVGLFCSTPMVPLARAIGRKRALEMLLTGELIDAATAATWGLVNRVVTADALEQAVGELAAAIAGFAPSVVSLGKQAFYAQAELDEMDAYDLTRDVMAANAADPDGQEGFAAFLEKRTPVWRPRG